MYLFEEVRLTSRLGNSVRRVYVVSVCVALLVKQQERFRTGNFSLRIGTVR